MINKRARKLWLENTKFMVQDANDLSAFSNLPFDVATISMAIHQFSPETGLHILQQLKSISNSVLILDYSSPQPQNYNGFIVRSIERIAGKEHFAHFRAYQHGGGMPGILHRIGLSTSNEIVSNSGIFTIWKVD